MVFNGLFFLMVLKIQGFGFRGFGQACRASTWGLGRAAWGPSFGI